ncbi:hypothetical protein HDZ31DRAFT_45414, partial [Schizophyllum fasciatum]
VQAALVLATIPVLVRRRGNARLLLASIIAVYITSTISAVMLIANRLIAAPTLGLHPPDIRGLSFSLYLVFTVSTRLNVRLWTGEPSLLTLTFTIPVLVTNMVSTSLVGIQLWLHRRDISASLGPFSTGSRVAGALMLLFESGLMYCALCCSILVLDIVTPNVVVRIDPVVLFRCALPPISGIYPLIVILIITAQQHTITQRMQNAGPSYWESLHFKTRFRNAESQDTADFAVSFFAANSGPCTPLEEIELTDLGGFNGAIDSMSSVRR